MDQVERTLDMRIPLLLTEEYWKRFNLSAGDIRETISHFPVRILFQLAIYYGISIPSSSLKIAFASQKRIIYDTRFHVIDKIMSMLDNRLPKHGGSVFLPDQCNHEPHLPFVKIPYEDYNRARETTPTDWNPLKPSEWTWAFNYRDVIMVSISQSDNAVCMHRVIPESEYRDVGNTMITRAPRALLNGVRYAITEEACWVTV